MQGARPLRGELSSVSTLMQLEEIIARHLDTFGLDDGAHGARASSSISEPLAALS